MPSRTARPQSQPILRAPRPSHPLAPTATEAYEVEEVPVASAVRPVPVAPATPVVPLAVVREPEPEPVRGDVPSAAGPTPEGEGMRTFTTRLPVELRRRLRRHAINTDQTLEQVARAMVTEYLDRHADD